MGVGVGVENLKRDEKQRKRSPFGEKRNMGKAIPHHQFQEWETTLYRRANGICKDKGPALKMYEWDMAEKEVAWRDYKQLINVDAW